MLVSWQEQEVCFKSSFVSLAEVWFLSYLLVAMNMNSCRCFRCEDLETKHKDCQIRALPFSNVVNDRLSTMSAVHLEQAVMIFGLVKTPSTYSVYWTYRLSRNELFGFGPGNLINPLRILLDTCAFTASAKNENYLLCGIPTSATDSCMLCL